MLFAISVASAAEKTMTGRISDSNCGASHAKMMAAHADAKTARDCTMACVKAGAKYVFVSGSKVYQISNQDQTDLEADAGRAVTVTGDVTGDTITVSKIARSTKKPS